MPVTIAHPIAAIPLQRPLGRLGVLSALVIGSITPDLPLFLSLSLSRDLTHTFGGLLWFCLPVGAFVYLLFDRVLERPLRALLPVAVQRRLPPVTARSRPPVWSVAVLVSILAGAFTHVLWDAFTHGETIVSDNLPLLETRLFRVSGYTVYVFNVLQHVSSVIGTAIMATWMRRWYRGAPLAGLDTVIGLTPRVRRWLLASMAIVVLLAAVAGGVSRFPEEPTLRALQPFARRLVVSGLSSLVVALMVYAVIWHWLRLRAARGPVTPFS